MLNCSFVCSFPDYVLDRTIIIGQGHEHKVSGYKLAKASIYFRSHLKKLRLKELKNIKEKESENNVTLTTSSNINQRTCTRSLDEIEYDRIKVNYSDTYGLEYILSFIHYQDNRENTALHIDHTNCKSIIKAALFFQVPSIIDFCSRQIEKNINYENCWNYYRIANELVNEYNNNNIQKFYNNIQNHILENFDKAIASELFLNLSLTEFTNFLKNDILNVKEYKLILIIEKWIEYQYEERITSFSNLLKCLRLGRLNENELSELKSHKLVLKYADECLELIDLAKLSSGDYVISDELSNRQSDKIELMSYIRKPRLPRQAIVVVGGWEGNQDDPNFGPSEAIQIYNSRANSWKRIIGEQMGLDKGHAYSSCVLHCDRIYVIGGYVLSGPTQTLKMFDLKFKKWKYMSPMHEKRNYITTCLLNNLIYAIGGHNGKNRLNSVERYDPVQNHWTFVAPMIHVRSDAGCDSLMDKLFVCGGFDGYHFYASVEMYDSKADQWTIVAPMDNMRSGVSVVTYRRFLFAIGGNDGLQRLRTVERYDPEFNRWQTMPPMIRQRSNFCLAVLEDEIYVMGGWSDESNSTISLVEKWPPGVTNKWIPVQQLYMPASANCCCTVSGIENIRELF